MTNLAQKSGAAPVTAAIPAKAAIDSGLSSGEAARRLQKDGPNAMPDTTLHPLRRALHKFWAPVPWMLEAAVALELGLGKYVEAAIIAALLGAGFSNCRDEWWHWSYGDNAWSVRHGFDHALYGLIPPPEGYTFVADREVGVKRIGYRRSQIAIYRAWG